MSFPSSFPSSVRFGNRFGPGNQPIHPLHRVNSLLSNPSVKGPILSASPPAPHSSQRHDSQRAPHSFLRARAFPNKSVSSAGF